MAEIAKRNLRLARAEINGEQTPRQDRKKRKNEHLVNAGSNERPMPVSAMPLRVRGSVWPVNTVSFWEQCDFRKGGLFLARGCGQTEWRWAVR